MLLTITTSENQDAAASEARTCCARFGEHRVTTHFGELIQGRFSTEQGPVRGLVTLPCPLFAAHVTAEIVRGNGSVVTRPAGRSKAARAARLTLAHLGASGCDAILTIRSDIPEGIGAGSSTGDVVAAIEAVGAALRRLLSPEEVAHLTIEAEQASDTIMFSGGIENPRLFAHRFGTTIEIFPGTLPSIEVVGISDGATVDTLSHPPASYSTRTIREFDVLRAGIRAAIAGGCASLLGSVTTRSAEINQAFLPKSRFATWIELADRSGAVGLSVSHSGSAVGFLFDAGDERRDERIGGLLDELEWEEAVPVVRYLLGEG